VSDNVRNSRVLTTLPIQIQTTPSTKRTATGENRESERTIKSRRIDFAEEIDYNTYTKIEIINLLNYKNIPHLKRETKQTLIEKLQTNGKISKLTSEVCLFV